MHSPSVEEAHEKGIKVLVTVDCGITSVEAAETANKIKDLRHEIATSMFYIHLTS